MLNFRSVIKIPVFDIFKHKTHSCANYAFPVCCQGQTIMNELEKKKHKWDKSQIVCATAEASVKGVARNFEICRSIL